MGDSADERWIIIPRWDEFQHPDTQRTRSTPWIKDYTEQLANDAYLELTFHQRGILHGLRQAYATSKRQLRGSTLALTRRLGQRVTMRDLEALNHAGLIEFSASRPASSVASRPASLDVEVEVEKENPLPMELPIKVGAPRRKLAVAADKTPSQLLWDALVGALGHEPSNSAARGAWNKAIALLRESGATPEQVRERSAEWVRRYADRTLTPNALAKNWDSLEPVVAQETKDARKLIERIERMKAEGTW